MPLMDMNLLIALDVLLSEESVTGAADKLNLSTPAMSRTLGRLRIALNDPLLVRAGRKLVPTPRALAIRGEVSEVLGSVEKILRPEKTIDLQNLKRNFTIRSNDIIIGQMASLLIKKLQTEAPQISLRFISEGREEVGDLREGNVDIDIGVIGETGSEIKIQKLLQDKFVGIVRKNHPLSKGKITPQRLTEFAHINVSRRGKMRGLMDDKLKELGLARKIAVVTPTFYPAFAIASSTDLIALAPQISVANLAKQFNLFVFDLPFEFPALTISQAWHPRFDTDAAHRLIREKLFALCQKL